MILLEKGLFENGVEKPMPSPKRSHSTHDSNVESSIVKNNRDKCEEIDVFLLQVKLSFQEQ